jgi:hypothetical protein
MVEDAKEEVIEVPLMGSVATFLETIPPGEVRRLSETAFSTDRHGRTTLEWPAAQFYCRECNGVRFADPKASTIDLGFASNDERNAFCDYACRNCHDFLKRFAIAISAPADEPDGHGTIVKVGEIPLFGPHVPSNVFELLAQDIEAFQKGLRSEAQGLGIAAFAYYRRVVESQRTHISMSSSPRRNMSGLTRR